MRRRWSVVVERACVSTRILEKIAHFVWDNDEVDLVENWHDDSFLIFLLSLPGSDMPGFVYWLIGLFYW